LFGTQKAEINKYDKNSFDLEKNPKINANKENDLSVFFLIF